MYSLNELESLIYKASIGAGLPVGCAQDIGTAGVWLARRRFPVFTILARALEEGYDAATQYVATAKGGEFLSARAAVTGPSAIDLLIAGDANDAEVHLLGLDAPALLLGLAGVAADNYGITFSVAITNCRYVVGPDGDVDAMSFPIEGPVDVLLRRSVDMDRKPLLEAPSRYDPISVADTGKPALDALAWKTYVPASAHSRISGAGAGLTDND